MDEMAFSEERDEVEAAGDSLEALSLSGSTATTAPGCHLKPDGNDDGSALAATSSQTAASAAAAPTVAPVPTVLENEDLLREILLRLAYPNRLIRAAAVSRFWLRVVSDPAFLKRFEKQNPLCALGFYVLADSLLHPRFVSAGGHHPDIIPLLELASSQFEVWEDVHATIWDCRNGMLLVEIGGKLEVRSYLTRPCAIAAYPQSPLKILLNRSFTYQHHEFLPDDGGDGHEYYRLALGHREGCIIACLSLLCGHIWVNRSSEVVDLPECATSSDFTVPYGKLGNGKVYLATTCGLVIILDVDTMKMHMVEVPDDLVEECHDLDLCPGQSDFEFYLFGLSQSALHVWLYGVSGSDLEIWKPLHRIPIQDMFMYLMSPGPEQTCMWDELTLWGIGEQAEFVLLKADNSVYQFDIEAKKLTKVLQMHPEDGELERIFPCMMIWPPVFPPRAYQPNSGSVRLGDMTAETISPETVNQRKIDQSHGVQKNAAVTWSYAARARRKLLNSQEEGQEYDSAIMAADAALD